jgi:hypothetical protein
MARHIWTWRDRLWFWWQRWRPYEYDWTAAPHRHRVWLTPWSYTSLCWDRLVCALGLQKGHDFPKRPAKRLLVVPLFTEPPQGIACALPVTPSKGKRDGS